MEYLGFLPLAVAVAAIGARCYFSARTDALQAAEPSGRSAAGAKRARQAALARRLLRYHQGLAHA